MRLLGSPDYFVYKESLFGIDEARGLSVAATKKAFTGRKIFFIAPEKITLEAQNALLKTFEDPVPDTHFFLAVRDTALVLPTLKSRMQVMTLESTDEVGEAKIFLKLSIKERLNFAKSFEGNLSEFLDQLLTLKRDKAIYEMRLYSDDRAASARLILEHLSLVL